MRKSVIKCYFVLFWGRRPHQLPSFFLPQVDDVTEIAAKSVRLRYTPQGLSPSSFCIFPFGTACLKDADTEYFDGGYLSFQPIGSSKGDQLGFLSQQHENALGPTGVFSTGETFAIIFSEDSRKIIWQAPSGLEVHVATVAWEGERTGCKISFAKGPEKVVSLNLASYILNCVTFSNHNDLRKPTSRSYQVKVSDGENLQEGKKKVTVESVSPLCYLWPWSYHVEVSCKLCDSVAFFDGKSKLLLGIPADKVLTSGYMHLDMEWTDSSYDDPGILALSQPFSVRDGGLYQKDLFLGKCTSSSVEWRIEFTWATKASGKVLLAMLRSFTYIGARKTNVKMKLSIVSDASGAHSTSCAVTLKF